MSIELKWKFPKVEKSKIDDIEDVVLSVEYQIDGTDGENTVTTHGKVLLDPPNIDDFVSYTSITNSMMVEWNNRKDKRAKLIFIIIKLLILTRRDTAAHL